MVVIFQKLKKIYVHRHVVVKSENSGFKASDSRQKKAETSWVVPQPQPSGEFKK